MGWDIKIYADDIAMWSDNKKELEEAVARWNQVLTEACLKMNTENTEVMKVCRSEEGDNYFGRYRRKQNKTCE